jgi:hypothetical protein
MNEPEPPKLTKSVGWVLVVLFLLFGVPALIYYLAVYLMFSGHL